MQFDYLTNLFGANYGHVLENNEDEQQQTTGEPSNYVSENNPETKDEGMSDSEAVASDVNKPVESEDKTSEPKPEQEGKLPADAENGESVVEKELTYWAFIYDFSQFKQAKSRVKLEDYFMKVMPVKDGPFQNPHTMKLRVRKVETDGQPKYELTMKVGSNYAKRVENTVEIPEGTFILYSKILTTRTAKHRYEFEDEHGTWYVDLFPNGAGGYHNWAQVELEYTNLDKVPHPPIKYEEILMPKGSGGNDAEHEAKYQEILKSISTLEKRNPNLPPLQAQEPTVEDNTPIEPQGEQPTEMEEEKITVNEISTTDEQKEANEEKLGKDADNPEDGDGEDGADTSEGEGDDTKSSDSVGDDGGSDSNSGEDADKSEPEDKSTDTEESSTEPEKGEADTSETAKEDKPVTESLQLLCATEKDVKHIVKINGFASTTMRRDTNNLLRQATKLSGVVESINEDALSAESADTSAFTEEAGERIRNQIDALLKQMVDGVDGSIKRFDEMNPNLKPTEMPPETKSRLSLLNDISNIIRTNENNHQAVVNATAAKMKFLNEIISNGAGTRAGRVGLYVKLLQGMSMMIKDLANDIDGDVIRREFGNLETTFTQFLLPKACEKVKQGDDADVYRLLIGNNTIMYTLNKDKEGLPINIVVTDTIVNKTVLESIIQAHAGGEVEMGSAADITTTYQDNTVKTSHIASYVNDMKSQLTDTLKSVSEELSNAIQISNKDDYWLGRMIIMTRSIINMMIAEIGIISYAFNNSHENQNALGSLILENLSPYSFRANV